MHDEHPLPGTDVVVDGVRLHVVRHGRDAHEGEPPVLLIHGLGTTSRLWSDVARDLEREHRCLAPDLAGCGRSELPTQARCAPAAQARLLLGLLDELGHGQVVVVGHDLGGAVAVELAAAAPERVRALVLVETPLHADVWPPRDLLPLLVPVIGPLYARARAGSELPATRRLAMGYDAEAVQATLGLVAAAPPPTLVLWGEDDQRLAPAYGRRLAGELPGATWVPIAGAGHRLPLERAERIAEEISGFLAELAPTG